MFDGYWRMGVEQVVKPIGKSLHRTGVNADVLTVIGIRLQPHNHHRKVSWVPLQEDPDAVVTCQVLEEPVQRPIILPGPSGEPLAQLVGGLENFLPASAACPTGLS